MCTNGRGRARIAHEYWKLHRLEKKERCKLWHFSRNCECSSSFVSMGIQIERTNLNAFLIDREFIDDGNSRVFNRIRCKTWERWRNSCNTHEPHDTHESLRSDERRQIDVLSKKTDRNQYWHIFNINTFLLRMWHMRSPACRRMCVWIVWMSLFAQIFFLFQHFNTN